MSGKQNEIIRALEKTKITKIYVLWMLVANSSVCELAHSACTFGEFVNRKFADLTKKIKLQRG